MITPSGSKTLCNFWIFPLTVLVLFMQGCATTKPTSVDPSAYKGRTKSIINEQVGHSGLFDVHPAETCRIGVLPNGDDSFERNLEYFLKIKESRGIFNTNIYWKATRKVLDNTTKVDMNHITDEWLNENVLELADKKLDLKYEGAKCRFFQNRPRFDETYIEQAYLKSIKDAL